GTLKPILFNRNWECITDNSDYFPLYELSEYALTLNERSEKLNFVSIDIGWDFYGSDEINHYLKLIAKDNTSVLCLSSSAKNAVQVMRSFINKLMNDKIHCPVIISIASHCTSIDEQLIHFATESGAIFLDGMGDGIWLINNPAKMMTQKVSGRTY